MQVSVHSNVGKQRKTNQDYADYFISEYNQYLFVLCDGVGGHQAGEVASELTTKFIGNKFKTEKTKLTLSTAEQWINDTIHEVNEYIFAESKSNIHYEGMGTTLIMALFVENKFLIAHVGDSRAYIYDGNDLVQLTEDHSLVNELIKSGEITEEEGYNHPRKNVVTQSIGVTGEVSYELQTIDNNQKISLMLCSDGLSNMVRREQMVQYFQESVPLTVLGDKLVEAANQAGGKDNITIILVSKQAEIRENVGEDE